MSQDDLNVEGSSLDVRLGAPGEVAESAAREFRARTFAARHPVWTFGVLPPCLFVVLALVLFLGPGLLLEPGLKRTGFEQYEMSPWVPVLARAYIVGCLLLAALGVVIVFTKLARRSGLGRGWPLTAALVTALACGALWTDATPKTPERMGTVMVGLSASYPPWRIGFPQLLQFALPLGAALWWTRPARPGGPTRPGGSCRWPVSLHAEG